MVPPTVRLGLGLVQALNPAMPGGIPGARREDVSRLCLIWVHDGWSRRPQVVLRGVITWQMYPKWSRNGPEMVPKCSQNCPKIVPKWPQNGPKMLPKWSQNGPKWSEALRMLRHEYLALVPREPNVSN